MRKLGVTSNKAINQRHFVAGQPKAVQDHCAPKLPIFAELIDLATHIT